MTDQQFALAAERYMDTIFRVAYGYLRSKADADDVTQDVLIQLYKTDAPFEGDEHLKRWLIRVTINRCKNIFRSPWHRMEDIADYEAALSFEAPECRELFDAVMALDKRYRAGAAVLLRGLLPEGDRRDAGGAGGDRPDAAVPGQREIESNIDGGTAI